MRDCYDCPAYDKNSIFRVKSSPLGYETELYNFNASMRPKQKCERPKNRKDYIARMDEMRAENRKPDPESTLEIFRKIKSDSEV